MARPDAAPGPRSLEDLDIEEIGPEEVDLIHGGAAAQPRPAKPSRMLRFRLAERMMHWSIALPFLVCLTSAALLVAVYNPDPTRPYRALVSTVHRYSGLALITLPLLSFVLRPEWRTHLENLRAGWVWSFSEIKWLALMPLAALSKSVRLPEEGKFNAGEKLNFMSTSVAYPVMGLTGLLIWNDSTAILPWYVHFAMAAVATPLVFGHMYMAIVNPASRIGLSGMFTGYVDRKWAKHHYRAWYREQNQNTVISKVAHMHAGPGPLFKLAFAAGWLAAAALAAGLYLVWRGELKLPGADSGPAAPVAGHLLEEAPLASAPADSAAAVPGGSVLRGAQVRLLRSAQGWALVEDLRGRAGWVKASLLAQAPPALSPSYPFPDCHPRLDGDQAECLARSKATSAACSAGCPAAQGPVCPTLCEERHEACDASCRGTATAATDAPDAGAAESAEPTPTPEPPAPPALVAAPKPAKAAVSTKPKRLATQNLRRKTAARP